MLHVMRQKKHQFAEFPEVGMAYAIGDNHMGLSSHGAAVKKEGIDTRRMCVECVASTGGIDRTGDICVPQGCVLTDFQLAPNVLFNHMQSPQYPVCIARAEDPDTGQCTVRIKPDIDVTSKHFFSPRNADSCAFFALIAEGLLNGVSVGFDPVEPPERLPPLPNGKRGHRYHKWSLLEISHVPIGMNARTGVTRVYEYERAGDLRTVLEKGKLAGYRITPFVRKAMLPYAATLKPTFNGWSAPPALIIKGSPMATAVKKNMGGAGMMESNGAAGGYGVGEQQMAPQHDAVVKGLQMLGTDKLKGMDGHSLHWHEASGTVHHSYPEDHDFDSPETQELHKAIWGLDGEQGSSINDVEHGPHPGPENEPGWVKCYPMQTGEVKSSKPAKKKGARPKVYAASKVQSVLKCFLNAKQRGRALLMLKGMEDDDYLKKADGDGDADDDPTAAGTDAKPSDAAGADAAGAEPNADGGAGAATGDDAAAGGDTGSTDATPTTGTDAAGNDADDDKESPEVESARGETKHGALVLQHCIEFLEGELPILDNPPLREYLTDVVNELKERGQSEYEDVDFGGEQAPEPGEGEDKTGEDIPGRYKTGESDKASETKSYLPSRVKRMGKRACGVIKGVIDHLDDLGDKEHGEPFTRTEKAACRYHHKNLSTLHKDLGGDGDMGDGEDGMMAKAGGADVTKGATPAEAQPDFGEVAKALSDVAGKMDAVQKTVFSITGKKI